MKTIERRKEYELKNGARFTIIEKIHYSDWGYWTWKQIFPFSGKFTYAITETHGYSYDIVHIHNDDCKSYLIPRH